MNRMYRVALMFADQIVFVSYLSEIFISRDTFDSFTTPTPALPRSTPGSSSVLHNWIFPISNEKLD